MSRGVKVRGHQIVKPATDYARLDRHGELQMVRKASKLVGYTAAPIVEKPKTKPADGEIARLLKLLDQDLRRAWLVLDRLPHGGQYIALKTAGSGALAAHWVETYINRSTDYGPAELERGLDGKMRLKHKPPRIRPAWPTPAEVSWMDRVFDLIIRVEGVWLKRLLWYRAARTPWGDIIELDAERRGDRQQRRLHNAGLIQMLWPWLEMTHKK